MTHPLPVALQHLLRASDATSVDAAWTAFVSEYSRLLLHVARSCGGTHDTAMDRYAYCLEQLRRDNFRRLRGYVSDGRGKFTTWLVVVVRRLCLDEARARYGRGSQDQPAARQRGDLIDLLGANLDLDQLPADEPHAEDRLRTGQLHDALRIAVAQLDPDSRLLLRLRFQDELPVAEIARVLSFRSVFHVYRRLNRLYGELRATLLASGIDEATP